MRIKNKMIENKIKDFGEAPKTLKNSFLTEEEFEVQMALGALEWFQFFDENEVDDSGMGDGPFLVWATTYEQALQVYMKDHGNCRGLSCARHKNGWVRLW
jgi:hypothetical protein